MVAYSIFRNNHICFKFKISFNRNEAIFAYSRRSLDSKYKKMHLQPELSRKCLFGVVRAKEMCLVAENVVLPHAGRS